MVTVMAAADTRDEVLARAYAAAAAVLDPEVPVLNLADLGVLRGVAWNEGRVVVRITPTYTGCPATFAIQLAVEAALRDVGLADARVDVVLAPAWTTDDMTDSGRAKLLAYGIAPPARRAGRRALFGDDCVACPKCGSAATEKITEFGSTACKALWRCTACREPFDYFKCL